jgi:hypothetical protein
MAGFSLYENAIHNVLMQYPSIWNKQEILLNNDHTGLEVMFVVPIAARISKAEESFKQRRYADHFSTRQ